MRAAHDAPPRVTVAIATWGRGPLILPTLQSVQRQEMGDFECLVVGDCDDSGACRVVRKLGDPRFRFVNLARRWATQSGPNNRAIRLAAAPILAYLGHDDIWLPNHLSAHLAAYERDPSLGLVASGVVTFRDPYGVRAPRVFGHYDRTDQYTPTTFTPPSGLSHRVDDKERLPRWRRREKTPTPVDRDFTQRMIETGYVAGSTGETTVLKWLSTIFYLSYFEPTAEAQIEALEDIAAGRIAANVARWVDAAKAADLFMAPLTEIATLGTQHNEMRDQVRGLIMAPPIPAGDDAMVPISDEPRGQDWAHINPKEGPYRWSGFTRRPRLYLPFTHDGPARVEVDVRAFHTWGLDGIALAHRGAPLPHEVVEADRAGRWVQGTIAFTLPLSTERGSVITIVLPPRGETDVPQRVHGIAVGEMRARPA
ncbi:glycosyltransferase family 2 protein [Acuticoccus sp.]|uniref:glycosyltransferase family 2 protein n=1 Tax=Acuticoccus sp. TaxID=1904378 RepID=UPI003B515957